jgi:hypothetical protein
MTNPRTIAGLIGPALMTIVASETINLHIWTTHIATLTYLNGCMLFVAGLAVVRAHNVWTRRWPVFVTLVGWLAMAGGLYRMFAPEAPQPSESIATYAALAMLFAIGCLLTFKAYVAGENAV